MHDQPEVEEFIIVPAAGVARQAIQMRDRIEDELAGAFPGLGFCLAIPEGVNGRKVQLPDEWWVIPMMGTSRR